MPLKLFRWDTQIDIFVKSPQISRKYFYLLFLQIPILFFRILYFSSKNAHANTYLSKKSDLNEHIFALLCCLILINQHWCFSI